MENEAKDLKFGLLNLPVVVQCALEERRYCVLSLDPKHPEVIDNLHGLIVCIRWVAESGQFAVILGGPDFPKAKLWECLPNYKDFVFGTQPAQEPVGAGA